MELRAIPKPKKKNDKGITERLRELRGQMSEYFEGVSRRTIYTSARRLGFVAITRTEGEGLRVWRGSDVPDPFVDMAIQSLDAEVPITKQDKLDTLRAMMADPKPFIEATPEPEDFWIDDPITFENGEILYWHHKPKCKPICYKRESDTDAA